MKRATALALALAATTLSPMALAGGDSGLYIGGSAGTTEISEDELDDDATGYKIFGGYNFGMVPFVNLAAELSYLDFGSFDADVDNVSVDSTAWALSALVGFDFGPVGLFGKAGYFAWDADFDSDFGSASEDGTDPAYGIGAKFQLGSFALRAEYEVFDLDGTDIDFYSVGAAYTF
jgi:outer membrane immunogenic protein